MNFLEDANLRFPHISEQILKELDNKSLTLCRELSTSMCDFIDNTKIPWMRIIQKSLPDWDNQKESWSILRRVRVDTVRQLACRIRLQWQVAGRTPLHFAARFRIRRGQMDVFLDVFERSKDKNPQDGNGETPLHTAALHGHLEVCQLILEQVEDKNPKDNFGETPLDLATNVNVRNLIKEKLKEKKSTKGPTKRKNTNQEKQKTKKAKVTKTETSNSKPTRRSARLMAKSQ